ncbi:MAG: methyltransferase domain-containing protein [Acholeplasmataceae bacterium]|jgi:SAM-dependent methyltransferase|nr:methyltransferase domain-containing protein [Acholeplasmataceae bacterium]
MFEHLYDLLMSDVDYEAILNQIEPYLNEYDFIIDAGCGSGYLLIELLKRHYQAIGLDLSTSMLAIAKDKMIEEKVMTDLYEHDLRKKIYAQADVILAMFDVMNYFKGIKGVLRNIYQALYPKGRFIFDVYKEEILSVYDGYVEDESDPTNYTWKIHVKDNRIDHMITHKHQTDTIRQYVHPLKDYLDYLDELGFEVEIKESIDPRKHLIIATK